VCAHHFKKDPKKGNNVTLDYFGGGGRRYLDSFSTAPNCECVNSYSRIFWDGRVNKKQIGISRQMNVNKIMMEMQLRFCLLTSGGFFYRDFYCILHVLVEASLVFAEGPILVCWFGSVLWELFKSF